MRRSRVASVNDAELGSLSPLLSTPVLGSPRPRSGTRSKAKERRSGTAGRRLTGRRIVYACALVLLVGLALLWSLQAVLVLAFFKLRNHATDERWWTRHGCRLRKRPLVFILDQASAAVVWETTCDMPALALDWALADAGEEASWRWATAAVEQIGMPGDRTETHFVQRSTISGLDGVGQLHLRVRDNDTVLATTTVPWTWASASATIAAVSDNQYNVRVFQYIVRAIRAFRRAPSLLLHAGDAVQTAGSLQMWQTDFWDPVALLGRRTPPILYSIGNHDHDTTRAYAYTIGRGPTWRAITIGASRWIVLNSQIDEGPGDAQEVFLRAELESAAWRDAAIRVIVVHVAPFVEYWEPASWTTGQEQLWSTHVRHRLAPIWHDADASLVISGHQHAYSAGLLPHAHAPILTPLASTAELDLSTLPAVGEGVNGTVYAIIGGAGGSLDLERVETWGFYERSVAGQHHWVSMTLERGPPSPLRGAHRVYRLGQACEMGAMADRLVWIAHAHDGHVLDRFAIERCS